MQVALSRVADDLTLEVLRRNPAVDPLDAELLISSLLHGVAVIARRWVDEFGGSTVRPPDGRGTTSWTDSSLACAPASAPTADRHLRRKHHPWPPSSTAWVASAPVAPASSS